MYLSLLTIDQEVEEDEENIKRVLPVMPTTRRKQKLEARVGGPDYMAKESVNIDTARVKIQCNLNMEKTCKHNKIAEDRVMQHGEQKG